MAGSEFRQANRSRLHARQFHTVGKLRPRAVERQRRWWLSECAKGARHLPTSGRRPKQKSRRNQATRSPARYGDCTDGPPTVTQGAGPAPRPSLPSGLSPLPVSLAASLENTPLPKRGQPNEARADARNAAAGPRPGAVLWERGTPAATDKQRAPSRRAPAGQAPVNEPGPGRASAPTSATRFLLRPASHRIDCDRDRRPPDPPLKMPSGFPS